MKKQFAIIAIALSAVGAAATVQAAEETYVLPTFSTLTRAEVRADLAAWRVAGLADAWGGEQTPDIYSTQYRQKFALYQHLLAQQTAGHSAAEQAYAPPVASTLTRTQVQADLAAWRAAGLADELHGEQTPDIYSVEYRHKFAVYQQLLAQQKVNRGTAGQ